MVTTGPVPLDVGELPARAGTDGTVPDRNEALAVAVAPGDGERLPFFIGTTEFKLANVNTNTRRIAMRHTSANIRCGVDRNFLPVLAKSGLLLTPYGC